MARTYSMVPSAGGAVNEVGTAQRVVAALAFMLNEAGEAGPPPPDPIVRDPLTFFTISAQDNRLGTGTAVGSGARIGGSTLVPPERRLGVKST